MNNSASASKRPRQSLGLGMASGLPTPGARRKSGIPAASPGASPTKRAPRNGHGSSSSAQNDDIANKMAELQAAIRKSDPASYGRPESRSSLHGQSEGDDDEMEEILADGDGEGGAEASSASTSTQLASPRRRTATARPSMTAPRRTSQGSLSSPGPAGSAGGLPGFAYQQRPATLPTTPSSATASGSYLHTRPPSSLSSSSYMSAHTHASTSGATPASRARSPAPGGFATPGRRQSEVMAGTGFLSHTASSMARSTSAASSADGPPSGLHVGDRVSALGMEGTLRYIGDVQFKPGVWGGIELSGEYAGKGKNNGTVQGVQYFACAENGGIFVQASKIDPSMPPPALPAPSTVGRARPPSALGASTASSIGGPTPRKILPRPSGAFIAPSTVARQATKASTEASQVAASRITAGSRASSYLNLTAKDLRAMRSATGESEAARKRSASPEKAGNLSASTASNVSAASTTTGVTPRPVRMGRPSVGGGVSTVLAGTRKSFGGPGTPTPASAIRRPPSAMRTHTPDIPSVPPLPVNLANPGTERQIASTGAPGTPSAARRYSAISRPSTPSARPSSRLSSVAGARSVSRASSRASMVSGASSRLGHRGGDDMLGASTADTSSSGPAVADLSEELQASREALARATREAEQAKLELLEMTSDLRDEKKRSRQLHNEVAELKRNAAASRLDEASAIDEREADRERHGIELEKLLNQLEEVKEQLARAQASKSEGEADVVQRLLEADKAIAERQTALKDREAIAEELANLQAGGRQAIEIYQEKVDILENQLFEEQNALSEAREELFEAKSRLSQHLKQAATQARNASNGLDPNSAEALLAASLGAGRQLEEQGESAVAIENDNLRAELEHMKSRMHRVEEELDEARALLENEQEKDKRKRQESGEVADRLRKEVKDQKERADSAWAERDKVAQRAEELEAALKDNERTLESERAELEVLRKERNDRPGTPSSAQEELRRAQKALSTLEQDKKAALAESSRLRSQLDDLQEELKLMEEVREDGAPGMPSPARLQAREQLERKDRRIHDLEQQLQGRPSAVANVPTNTDRDGSPDALRNPDGEFSSGATTSLHASDALVQLQQAREERDKLEKVNQRLVKEATKMRDAQRALEQTVNNLMEQMDGSGSSQKLGLSAPVPQRSLSQDTLEAEVTDLRKQLEKAQRVHEKERTNLHSEVSQLESLVEAKIFREDELEQQLDDAKRALGEAKAKLAQASANANAAGTTARDAKATLKAAPPGASNGRRSASLHSDTDDEDGSCELCGDPHGIENCPIFAGSAVSPELQQKPIAAPARQPAGPFCDDCEEYGHDLENCPMANEVF